MTLTDLRDDLVVLTRVTDESTLDGITEAAVNAVRFLAADAVEAAGSGHPGTPIALAPLAYRLYTTHLRHDPSDPEWFDRDRLVLSIGHASMLLYAALHLAGYDVKLDDIRAFRQLGSRTPGHPERGETPGIDMSTGPLGQGVANGVGFAVAEKMLASRYNRPGCTVVDHHTWVIAGDGDMMEGISSEAASLAGRLGLDKLTVFYDDNRISLEGATDVEFCEDVADRFAAYGWHVETVGCVNDLAAIDAAIDSARAETGRPTLVVVRSNIGYGTPKQDTAAAHGNPLGADAVAATRRKLNWPHGPFEVPAEVYEHWRADNGERENTRHRWEAGVERLRRDHDMVGAEFCRVVAGDPPPEWRQSMPTFEDEGTVSGRDASGIVINALASVAPELVGGSADVAPSTKTQIHDSGDVNSGDWTGRNIHFGVREHAMGAITNAMAAHGGLRPYCATFFVFSDYLRPAVRMAALMGLPVVWVMTHDSIGVGEDGPTHQPVEHLASFRAMPGLVVLRPADANETAAAWAAAIDRQGPTMLVLSRQGLPVLDGDPDAAGRIVAGGDHASIVATGSEIAVALDARERLAAEGVEARVVSMPSWEMFRARPENERVAILGPGPVVAVEAGATQGWLEFADDVVGIDRFGASAPASDVFEVVGVTVDAVVSRVLDLLRGNHGAG